MAKVWTEERDDALKACFAADMSYLDAALSLSDTLQTTITRSMVGSRATRLGLKTINPPSSSVIKRKRVRKHRPQSKKTPPLAISSRPAVQRLIPAGVSTFRCVEITPLNLDLVELEKGQCRFPYGDSVFTFCGHPALDGRSYCGPHTAVTAKIMEVAR